jgi:hypothetical protein
MPDSKPYSQLLNQISANDIIREIKPVVMPRISAISHIAMCERAAYNIDFLGMQSGDFSAAGEIGSAVHRIVIKSTLEIVDSIRKTKDVISNANAIALFRSNAIEDVNINWKRFVLAGVERPLPVIMEDLDIRAERIASQLLSKKKGKKIDEISNDQNQKFETVIFRPEFTIRNIQIPLEGRLDLVKIELSKPDLDQPTNTNTYLSSNELAQAKIQDVEIIQIKTGKARPRNSQWNLQADAEALLLMKALNLKTPPKYTWQFSDRDAKRKKFDFTKVYTAADKFIKLWKSEISPNATGYCPNCPLKKGCLEWSFAGNYKLTYEDQIRRSEEFKLSKRIREEVSYVDRWKVYVCLRSPEQRQNEGAAITNLKIDMTSIQPESQEIKLLFDKNNCDATIDKSAEDRSQKKIFSNTFIDFSIGDYVTISDGNPNLGSNPTATITEIDLAKGYIKLQLYRNDLYFLLFEDRYKTPITIDRFGFSNLKTIGYLDDFFRNSPYADIILQRRTQTFSVNEDDAN